MAGDVDSQSSNDVAFVDVHVHFWDHDVAGLRWDWLRRGFTFRRWTGTGSIDAPRYLPADLRAEAEGSGLAAVVHGHCADPIDDPVQESRWLDAVAGEDGMPEALVGACRLGDPGAADVLVRHARIGRVRGVRDPSLLHHLVVDDVAAAMDVAAELGISVELRRDHRELAEVHELAARWPGVTIVLSHACLPIDRTDRDLAEWSTAMRNLAEQPNVVCKISAVAGASDPDWTVASIRPWILTCIEAFGSDRCALASNWPVDRLFGGYVQLVDAYREVTSLLTVSEQMDVFNGTARRVYGLADRS